MPTGLPSRKNTTSRIGLTDRTLACTRISPITAAPSVGEMKSTHSSPAAAVWPPLMVIAKITTPINRSRHFTEALLRARCSRDP